MALYGSRSAAPATRKSRCSLARLSILALGLCLASATVSRSFAFVAGAGAPRTSRRGPSVSLAAEAESKESSALVKITEDSKITSASLLGGLAGLLLGGVWVGAASFVAASYFSRQDNDVGTALKGIGSSSLEVLNFGGSVNDKYEVTGKVGSALSDAVENAKKTESTKDAAGAVTSAVGGISSAVESVDKEVGIKDTLGNFATSASDLAAQAVDKAVDLNKEYKVTDQISEKINEATKSTK